MISLKPLTVGPLLGAVTDKTARIFGRGEYILSEQALPLDYSIASHRPFQPCFGAIRIRAMGQPDFKPPQFFKMDPNFDMSGVITLENLQSETEYEYQMGWFLSETEPASDLELDWSAAIHQQFKSGSADSQKSRSFIMGSCRYLQRVAPKIWKYAAEGDQTFASILKQVESGLSTDAFLMVGDQIYADDFFSWTTESDLVLDQYFTRYRESFSQPYIQKLMGRVPTYMTLDDHEFKDGWPDVTPKELDLVYAPALHAYETYQLSHSPLFSSLEEGEDRYRNFQPRLWYTYQDGCCDFFATDSRTERQLGDTDETRAMLGYEQMESLKQWLCDGSGRIKFIITSVPFVPDKLSSSDPNGLDSDKWAGFLKQRTELLDLIFENDIKRVVFLSGDVACGMTSEIRCQERPDFKVISIISSGLYWPLYHRKAKHFQMEGEIKTLSNHSYQLTESGPVISTDHFMRVTADLDGITAEGFISGTGESCGKKVHQF